jgi:hypothetical protein
MFVMVLKKKQKKRKSGFDKLVDDIKSIINMYRRGKDACKGKKTKVRKIQG